MCPFVTNPADLSSLLLRSVLLNEINSAGSDLGMDPLPGGTTPEDALEKYFKELTQRLTDDWMTKFPRVGCSAPHVGAFAPIEAERIRSDPSCTVEYFTMALKQWHIVPVTPDAFEPSVREAVGRLNLQVGGTYSMYDCAPMTGNETLSWMTWYAPVSMPGDQVGVLFAFSAARGDA